MLIAQRCLRFYLLCLTDHLGSHPFISGLIKGAFRSRPSQPRYSATWDVTSVLNYLRSLGPNDDLSLKLLSFKSVILCALCQPKRRSEIAQFSLDSFQQFPDRWIFSLPLTKTRKASRPADSVTFSSFPSDTLLCPVSCLSAYVSRTHSLHYICILSLAPWFSFSLNYRSMDFVTIDTCRSQCN